MVKFYLFITNWKALKQKITNFKLIRLHLQKKIILKMFISTTSPSQPSILLLGLEKKWILLQLLQ